MRNELIKSIKLAKACEIFLPSFFFRDYENFWKKNIPFSKILDLLNKIFIILFFLYYCSWRRYTKFIFTKQYYFFLYNLLQSIYCHLLYNTLNLNIMRKVVFCIVLLLLCSSIFAQEYVFVSSRFSLVKGDTLDMHLFVADGFNVEAERPMQTQMTREFKLFTNEGKTNLKEKIKDNSLPIIHMPIDFEGLGLFYLERDYERVVLDTDSFKEYLIEDRLENIELSKEQQAKEVQTDRYSRYVKALVRSSGDIQMDTLYKTVLGNNLEIVLLENPYLLKKGDFIQAKVLFMGEPLKNKVIFAHNRLGGLYVLVFESRTNEEGICSFKLERKGVWFINTTHLIANSNKNDTDWESFWTSYSFAIE